MNKNFLEEFAELIANKFVEIIETKEGVRFNLQEQKSQLDQLLTTKEAADFYKCHINTVRSWISKGELEGKRIGNRLYVVISKHEGDDLPF